MQYPVGNILIVHIHHQAATIHMLRMTKIFHYSLTLTRLHSVTHSITEALKSLTCHVQKMAGKSDAKIFRRGNKQELFEFDCKQVTDYKEENHKLNDLHELWKEPRSG